MNPKLNVQFICNVCCLLNFFLCEKRHREVLILIWQQVLFGIEHLEKLLLLPYLLIVMLEYVLDFVLI